MPEAPFGRSSRWLTTLTVDPELCGISRDQIIDTLEAENIEARPVWKPMQLQPLYRGCKFYPHPQGNGDRDRGPFHLSYGNSVSEQLFEHGLCLPSGSSLRQEEQERVIYCIKKLL